MIIKQIIKVFSDCIYKSFATIIWLLRAVVLTDFRNHIKKGDHKQLSILANGPSLSKELESINLDEGDFSVLNFFYKSPVFKQIKPTVYVLADPYFFTDDHMMPILESVDWPMSLFVPYRAWRSLSVLKKCPNKHIHVIPYHTGDYAGFECIRHWLYKHGLSMPIAQNVLVPSIFNAINMGYKEILLYGVDHSWTETIRVNSRNEVCQVNTHFYDDKEVELKPFKKCSGEQYLMHEILRDFAQMFESYHYIRKYADLVGCRIINCTKNSFIDAFERAK